ncbi:MAG: hypothetical protein DRP56_04145, partial [Planctomycetota bacterium]
MINEWIEILGWITTVLAVAGVVLNNRMDRRCFWLWMVSNAISAWIHIHTGIYPLAVRDAAFLALAIWGLKNWSQKQKTESFKRNVSNLQVS